MFKFFTLGNFLRQVLILAFSAFCTLFNLSLQAQDNSETGLPLITNYNPEVRPNIQTWAAVEDSRGIMYFGAAKGILEYDGTKWRELKADRPDYMDAVRAVAKNVKGTIYFGAVGEIGYLDKDSTGLMKAKSLIHLVPEKDRDFLAVWSINTAGDDVYFQSRENLIRINPVTKAVKVWTPDTRFLYTFYLDNRLFVHQQGKGLYKMVNDQLELIPGSEFTGDERMQLMLPYPPENGVNRYLVGLFYSGLYVFDGKSFTKLKTEADGIFKNALLYKGVLLDEQTYAISTAGSGVALINAQGKLLKIYNKAIGLQDESVYGLYKDSQNKLWLTLDVGISRVDYDAPYSIFSAPSGINSSTLILTRFKGDLFLGTTSGLLKYDRAKRLFERVEGVPSHQIFDLVIDGDDLLVTGDGLFAYRNGKVRLLKESKGGDLSIFSLKVPQSSPNLLFAGTSTGLYVFFRRANEEWKIVGSIPDVIEPVWSLGEEKDGKIWAGTQNGFAYLIIPAFNSNGYPDLKKFKIEEFNQTHGWTNATGQVIELDKQMYFIGTKGFFNFDHNTKKFQPDTILGKLTNGGGDEESDLIKDRSGRVWVRFGKVTYTATPKPDGTFNFDTTPFLPLTEKSISRIYPEENGITWFTVTEGVLRYDENLKKNYDQSYKTIITNVMNGKNHLNPGKDLNNELPEISYRNNTLRFDFAAPFFEQEKLTQYQTWLEGFENEWSEFGTNHYKEYTNLPSGQYTFHVRAKNVYNKLSEESIFTLSVTPPWYATWWAYLLYVLAAAGVIALIVRYRTLHLREQHRELEKIVAERTHELSQRVEELAVINSVQESLVKEIDMDGIYHLIGEKIREIFNAQVIDIVTYDSPTNIIEDRYAYEKGDTTKLGPRELSGFRKPVVERGELLLINKNVLELARQQNISALIGDVPKSLVIVPMKNQDKVTGMISLQDLDKEDAFSEADVNLLKTLANSMSVALESARRFDETKRLLKETEQRNAELAVINSVQEGLVREMNMKGIFDLVGEKMREIFNAQVIDIVTYDAETDTIEDRYSYEKGDRTLLGPRPPLGLRKHILETRQPFFIGENLEEIFRKFNHEIVQGDLPKSIAFVPMIAGGEVKGVISLQNLDHENAFSESDHSLLTTLANSMSMALESARLFDETNRLLKETKQRNAELGVINSVQDGLVREMNIQGIYDLVGEKIREIFTAQVIDIVMYDPKTNMIEDRYAYEKGDRSLIGSREPLGFRKHVLESKQPLFINKDYEKTAVRYNNDVIFGEVPKSVAFVPLLAAGEVKGIISLQNLDHENAFSESDHSLLMTLSNSMSVALESARLFDETTRLLKETEQRNAELAVINSVQDGLVAHLDMQHIYDLVGEKIREIFNAQVIDIVTYDAFSYTIEDKYSYEKGDRTLLGKREPKGFRKHVIETRQLLLHNENVAEESIRFGNVTLQGEMAKSQVFVPMIAGGEIKGIISLQNLDHEHAFKESDVRLLTTLANSMSVALEGARLFDETKRLLRETEQRNAELAVINSVQDGLVAHLDIQHIYDLVGEKIREIFNAQVIDIVTYDSISETIEDKYAYEKGDRTLIAKRPATGFRKHVIETRQLLLHNENVEEEASKYGNVTMHGEMARSQVFVPMIAGGDIKGIISLQNLDKEHAFKESDVRLLTTLANSMSVALEGARLFDETKRLLLETEQRTAELAVINSVQEGLVREMDAESIYELVGEKMRQIFNAQVIDIVTYDRNANIIEDRYAYEKGDRSILAPREPYGYRKHVIDTKQILVLNDKMEEYAKQYGNKVMLGEMTKSAVFVPMMESNEVTGIVSLQNIDQENAFSDSDIRLLVTLSNSLSIALQNARLFEETSKLLAESKQRMTELSTVNSVSKALASQLNPEELINLVGSKMKDLFNANIVYLALLNPKTKIIYFPYQFGDNLVPMKLGEGLTSHVIITGEPLLLNKEQEGAHTTLGFQRVGIPAASYLGVPIPDGDNIIGVLSVQSTEKENRFTENDQRLLSTIAASVGVALRNAQLFEEVQLAKLEAETASKIAEKANEAKSAFLSTVSHELRTPLTSVLGFAKIIRKRLEEKIFPLTDVTDPRTTKTIQQVSDNLSVVVSEGERLTHLINDVLDLAKIEAGKMEWSEEWLSIAEVVDRASSATSTLFDQKNLLLEKYFEDNIPQIRGDKDKLIQVVVNLLSNAVKFTDSGSVTCRIRKHEGEIIVDITDTGIGIAPEDHNAVFEQFKQVGDTLTDKPKGTGLGLPICKEIVEHHGGRIWLTSEPGKGSTFSFSVPVETVKSTRPLALNDLVAQLREQMAETAIPGMNKNSTILIVDDDDSIRSLLYQELSEAGYQINEATNGKEALISIRNNRPDLIILDVMMPEMNGFDVAAVLRNDPQTMDIPIIVLSIVQDKARGFRIGVDRYLTKPIDTGVLFTEVDSLLQQGKSRKKVLVVDEDSTTVKTLVEVLKAKGYSVVESVGDEMIQTAITSQPDIIIVNALLSVKTDYAEALRLEKGLENVLFLVYQ